MDNIMIAATQNKGKLKELRLITEKYGRMMASTAPERYEELKSVLPALQLFGVIDEKYVAPDAMIREFIGGGALYS